MVKYYKDLLRKKALNRDPNKKDIKNLIENASILIDKIKPKFVGLYKSLHHEFDLTPIIDIYNQVGFCFPKIENENMEFYLCDKKTIFSKNPRYNFFEPESNIETTAELIFVPGLAFDIHGYRLGFGKGHYDKYFANKFKLGYKHILVGVCPYGLEPIIPREPHDIKMDYLIFCSNILKV